jgi:hypothetical protein
LQKLLLQSELYVALREEEYLAPQKFLSGLNTLERGLSSDALSSSLGMHVLAYGAASMARHLESEWHELQRLKSLAKQKSSMERYAVSVKQLVNLASGVDETVFYHTVRPYDASKVEGNLLKFAPKLLLADGAQKAGAQKAGAQKAGAQKAGAQKAGGEKAAAGKAAAGKAAAEKAAAEKAAAKKAAAEKVAASKKRNKDEAALHGNSPANKKGGGEEDVPSDRSKGSGVSRRDLSELLGGIELTPLAVGQLQSNQTKVSELTKELTDLRLQFTTSEVSTSHISYPFPFPFPSGPIPYPIPCSHIPSHVPIPCPIPHPSKQTKCRLPPLT